MTDWREHNGGPQPVADNVWVEASPETPWDGPAKDYFWSEPVRYRILNQHLIDAARLEGIRLGLEAAAWWLTEIANTAGEPASRTLLAGASRLRDLNADTIAREAVLDQLTREAQADNMGYDKEAAR